MELQKCARCGKRPAVVFITRMENNKTFNEGLCLVCAKELGIKPVDDILKKMGMSDEDVENMSGEVEGMLEAVADTDIDTANDGGAPAIDFQKLFPNFGFPFGGMQQGGGKKQKGDAQGKKPPKQDESKKLLSTYCTNLTEKAKSGKRIKHFPEVVTYVVDYGTCIARKSEGDFDGRGFYR